MALPLTAEKARIFRITHIDNMPSILQDGIPSRSSVNPQQRYRNIGSPDLIWKRSSRAVPIPPGGTLSDYIPFYFTSRTPMLLNIKTGRNVPAVPMEEIVILVSDLHRLKELDVPFVFTDQHAYLRAAQFFCDIADIQRVDWDILARSDFAYDPNDLGKSDRYQAEALVHRHVPRDAISGIICWSEKQKTLLTTMATAAGADVPMTVKRTFYV